VKCANLRSAEWWRPALVRGKWLTLGERENVYRNWPVNFKRTYQFGEVGVNVMIILKRTLTK
jgi:hypothetical protein